MSWFDRFFGGRRERARRIKAASADVAALLSAGDLAGAEAALRPALLAEPDAPELLHRAADLMVRLGDTSLAELFARAADATGDVQRAFELGSNLLSREDATLAAAVLLRAAEMAPFHAVLRSETAIALARAGRPREVVETLALHPNLAGDPGALFEFAWASLLMGDAEAARGSRAQLASLGTAPRLLHKLEAALERPKLAPARRPADARDFYFLEHGGLLLDGRGEGGGRYGKVTLDQPTLEAILGRATTALRELWTGPRRIIAGGAEDLPLAKAIAGALDAELIEKVPGRVPSGLFVVRDAQELEAQVSRLGDDASEVFTFALFVQYGTSVARAPDIVGLLGREVVDPGLEPETWPAIEDAALEAFIRDRREHLPPEGNRVHTAYLPDAPLPWP
ncbi:MAG: hypothetical protein DRJ42_27115 [Deltaproteobacteria bacterium]|nr:MAG: hypothetical protein DRJ42_27115 [Deltaproteobacteria bacterium]